MYNRPPLASHKYTCMEGLTTALNTNQWTPEEQLLFKKKNNERCHQQSFGDIVSSRLPTRCLTLSKQAKAFD